MTSDETLFPIVGIGASAGGVQALDEFFRAVPADCGLAFVIITHLSPNHASHLHEILARCTTLPVLVAADLMKVRPGTVYVMPESTFLTIETGYLRTHKRDVGLRERNPIDVFFASLAKDQTDCAVGIVLSGGGGDGTLGIRAIKDLGGVTLAQRGDGTAPRHPDMPESAIATGLVDFPIPVQDMPAKLMQLKQSFALGESLAAPPYETETEGFAASRKAIYDALRTQTGHDFSGYKSKTFLRRVQRRMQIVEIATIDAYAGHLESDHDEVTHLFRDLLINVTNFFRDLDAFDALKAVIIPSLFEGRRADETVRVWVPGCATGEEVYSIAMLLREHMDTLKVQPHVQIFATDIDDPALLVARAARFPETLLDSISPARLKRFFVEDGGSFVVAKEVRDLCIFSPHSVIRDPPFSRIDLISCRNLLIYFGPDIQNQVIPIFHYSLKPGGYLFLGTSENIGQFSELFAAVDKKQRIFQARDHGMAKRLPIAMHGAGSLPIVRSHLPSLQNVPLRHLVEARVIDRFAPAHVVVNAEGDVVYCSQRTGKYLEVPHGPPSRQLMAMARKGLRLDLRSALHDAMESRQTTIRNNVAINEDGDDIQTVKLTVDPFQVGEAGESLFLVLFEDVGLALPRGTSRTRDRSTIDIAVANLEHDLRDTRERLQTMIEEYETALEELKSSNEELVSVNEELQSANEELEASKEELQSLNEELQTVNTELIGKLDDLDRANSDLKNLFESTQIPTVFLDRDLVIRSFTPAVSSISRIIPSDRGRPLTDLAIHPAYPALHDHVRRVFETGETIEHHIVRQADQTSYLVRLIPYRGREETIEGVVVTFVDITSLTKAENQQDVLIAELNHRVKTILAVTIGIALHMAPETSSIEAYRDALIGRLDAMAGAYDLIARGNWTDVGADAILNQCLIPFGEGRFRLRGPDIRLTPRAGLSLGMAVLELATNAAEHGAFSVKSGAVDVTWALSGDGELVLRWIKCGGPPSGEPIVRRLGLKLVERQVEFGLKGDVTVESVDEGLVLTLRFEC